MKHFYFYAFRKQLVRSIGWFDERFVGGGWEEYDFLIRADEAGLPVYRTEEAVEWFMAGPSRWRYHDPEWSNVVTAHMDAKWIDWMLEVKRFEFFAANPYRAHDEMYQCYTDDDRKRIPKRRPNGVQEETHPYRLESNMSLVQQE